MTATTQTNRAHLDTDGINMCSIGLVVVMYKQRHTYK